MKTKVFKSGNSLAVRLPKGMDLPCGDVSIRREGNSIVIEELRSTWPEGFFDEIRIEREDFDRQPEYYKEKSL